MKKSFCQFAMLMLAIAFFQSCSEAPKDTTTSTDVPPADTTAIAPKTSSSEQAVAEQMAAFYTGKLPCPDCDGIQTLLTLNADEQRTYTLSEEYKGKQPKTVESNGTWAVEGAVVTLTGKTGTVKYQVTADGLVAMKADGTVMDVSKYLLRKVQGE